MQMEVFNERQKYIERVSNEGASLQWLQKLAINSFRKLLKRAEEPTSSCTQISVFRVAGAPSPYAESGHDRRMTRISSACQKICRASPQLPLSLPPPAPSPQICEPTCIKLHQYYTPEKSVNDLSSAVFKPTEVHE
jgi:hypothetical protein